MKIKCCVFLCLWFNHATKHPISKKFFTEMAYICASGIDLFQFQYLSPFQDVGSLRDKNTRQKYKITMLQLIEFP